MAHATSGACHQLVGSCRLRLLQSDDMEFRVGSARVNVDRLSLSVP